MADPREVSSVLVALEFVVVAAAVLLLVPHDATVALIPLFLLFLVSLLAYVYRGRPPPATVVGNPRVGNSRFASPALALCITVGDGVSRRRTPVLSGIRCNDPT